MWAAIYLVVGISLALLRKYGLETISARQILEEIAHHHLHFDRILVMVPDIIGSKLVTSALTLLIIKDVILLGL